MRHTHPQTHFLTVCSSLAGWKQWGRKAGFLSACRVPKPRDQDFQWTSRAFTDHKQALSRDLIFTTPRPANWHNLAKHVFQTRRDRSQVLTSLHQLSLVAEDLGKGGGSTGESVLHGRDVPLGLTGKSLNDTPRRKAPVCRPSPLRIAAGATLQLCKNSTEVSARDGER